MAEFSGLLARHPELGAHCVFYSGVFNLREFQIERQLLHLNPHGAILSSKVEEVVLELPGGALHSSSYDGGDVFCNWQIKAPTSS